MLFERSITNKLFGSFIVSLLDFDFIFFVLALFSLGE